MLLLNFDDATQYNFKNFYMHSIIKKKNLTFKLVYQNTKALGTPWWLQLNDQNIHIKKRPEVIYQWEDHNLIILKPSLDSKVEALQWWSTQDWSGPFSTRHGAAAFFASALSIVLCKNWLHQCLYAFMISTKISLEILSQKITPHINQILCSTYE